MDTTPNYHSLDKLPNLKPNNKRASISHYFNIYYYFRTSFNRNTILSITFS